MLTQTLHIRRNKTTHDVETEFESMRESYNKDLAKLRKKYLKMFTALAVDHEALQRLSR